jgi:hypothetical protein
MYFKNFLAIKKNKQERKKYFFRIFKINIKLNFIKIIINYFFFYFYKITFLI